MKLRTASESVGWMNSVGPLTVSPRFNVEEKSMEELTSKELTADEAKVLELIRREFIRARKFPEFHSAHEGYAVLKEEVDELWDAIKDNKHTSAIDRAEEAIQVAAMAMKYVASLTPATSVELMLTGYEIGRI